MKRRGSCPAAAAAGGRGIHGTACHEPFLVLVRELLERQLLRLLDQQRREDAREHPEREDLQAIRKSWPSAHAPCKAIDRT